MSAADQEPIMKLVAQLLQRKGAWKYIGGLTALPIIIGTVVALVTYNFAAINYLNKVNFAALNAPLLAKAVVVQNANIGYIRNAMVTMQDTLNSDGYYFAPIPSLIPVPEVPSRE